MVKGTWLYNVFCSEKDLINMSKRAKMLPTEQSIYLSVCVYVYYTSGSCTLFQEHNKYVDQHRRGL